MLTVEEVKHIATLARVGLDESEVSVYQKNLSAILDSFEHLSKADINLEDDVEYLTGVTNTLREDIARTPDERECVGICGNMPEMKDGFLKVKSVF